MENRRIVSHAILSIVMLTAMAGRSIAQDSTTNTGSQYFWIAGGLGAGLPGVAAGIALTWAAPDHIVSLRYAASSEINIFGPSPWEQVFDVGLLYGVYSSSQYGFASIAGGVSYVNGVRRGKSVATSLFGEEFEKDPFQTVGIPLEAQLFFRPVRVLGIGIYLYADINSEMSTVGGLISLQIGYLR